MSRVLIIGDLHCPADLSAYLPFCKQVYKKYKCTEVLFIGDIVDHESVSSHDKNPALPSPSDEFCMANERIKRWYNAFPKATVTIGNHDDRVHRKLHKNGVPSMYLRSFAEIYGTPGWRWVYDKEIDSVYYYHGDGGSTGLPSFNVAKNRLQSVVCGHHHSAAGIMWIKGPRSTQFFGMNVGCGVDMHHSALNYARPHLRKAVLSCGIVIDGIPYLEIM